MGRAGEKKSKIGAVRSTSLTHAVAHQRYASDYRENDSVDNVVSPWALCGRFLSIRREGWYMVLYIQRCMGNDAAHVTDLDSTTQPEALCSSVARSRR